MTIDYMVQKDDLIWLWKRQLEGLEELNKMLSRNQRWMIPLYVLLVLASLYLGFVSIWQIRWFYFLIAAVCSVVIYYYVVHFPKWVRKRALDAMIKEHGKNQHQPPYKFQLTLTPEAVISKSEQGESKATWKSIDNIELLSCYLLIWLNKQEAFIIPNNGLIPENEFTEFSKLAQNYFNISRKQP